MRIILIFILIGLVSCEEIVSVADISQDEVVVLAPQNETVLSSSNVNFSWDPVAFAEAYSIQVAAPDFQVASEILLDTIVVDTSSNTKYNIMKTFQPGNYSWRIRASNSGYTTIASVQKFSVSEDASLIGKQVVLNSPEADIEFTTPRVTFNWESLVEADVYRFELLVKNSEEVLISDIFLTTSFEYTFENSGSYIWKVRAENDRENTLYSERGLEINLD
ncbi:hypothetical protein [Leeuwenhoekiella sp. H156]|uniref:hypothetical protein n=1 Tax=Leeuwenhoekiella sp. H156 TaxID=3450128 RepID=UPI003FA492DD